MEPFQGCKTFKPCINYQMSCFCLILPQMFCKQLTTSLMSLMLFPAMIQIITPLVIVISSTFTAVSFELGVEHEVPGLQLQNCCRLRNPPISVCFYPFVEQDLAFKKDYVGQMHNNFDNNGFCIVRKNKKRLSSIFYFASLNPHYLTKINFEYYFPLIDQ